MDVLMLRKMFWSQRPDTFISLSPSAQEHVIQSHIMIVPCTIWLRQCDILGGGRWWHMRFHPAELLTPLPLCLLPVVFQAIHSVAWHHEGKQFICSHSDGTLTIWNIRGQGKPIQTITPHGKVETDIHTHACTNRVYGFTLQLKVTWIHFFFSNVTHLNFFPDISYEI